MGREELAFLSAQELAHKRRGIIPWSFAGSIAVAGAVLAIPTTHSVVLKTTGGVEALTLADGDPGQVLHVILSVDGGTGTLTPATTTGFASIVFADVKDRATLLFVDESIGWIIQGLSGVAGPPLST